MEAQANVEYWDERAAAASDTITATHRDRFQRSMELEQVNLNWPEEKPRVLDVGCGAGWTDACIAPLSTEVVGIDRSPEMIKSARDTYYGTPNLRFEVGDVLSLPHNWSQSFDLVISQRCLINLSGWDEQQAALNEIARVLRPGGRFIMQEGTQQGREALNQARLKVGLERMPVVIYNRDFDEDLLFPFLRWQFNTISNTRFGVYDLICRVVHPLLVAPNEPRYDAPINEVAYRLAASMMGLGGQNHISREFSLVLQKK